MLRMHQKTTACTHRIPAAADRPRIAAPRHPSIAPPGGRVLLSRLVYFPFLFASLEIEERRAGDRPAAKHVSCPVKLIEHDRSRMPPSSLAFPRNTFPARSQPCANIRPGLDGRTSSSNAARLSCTIYPGLPPRQNARIIIPRPPGFRFGFGRSRGTVLYNISRVSTPRPSKAGGPSFQSSRNSRRRIFPDIGSFSAGRSLTRSFVNL